MSVLRDYAAALPAAGSTDGPGDSADGGWDPTLAETGTFPAVPLGATAAGPPRYDEVVAPDGSLRPAWRGLGHLASGWEPGDLRRVGEEVGRLLDDDGVTWQRRGSAARPWRLDPVPLVLDAASWAPLETGLAQRAELLDALVTDLYGEQRVLRSGLLPAPVVHGHAGYVRAAVTPGGPTHPLVLTAADLGRDAAGDWRVLADRAGAPAGLGYVVENRHVVSSVLPELYREADPHRVEPYLWALRSALFQAVEGDRPSPRVVVLSPGPAAEAGFDHTHLASLLGLPLVQGSDLVVRDGWLAMRVSGRLERVDVVLRRVDARWCDPLELRGDSRLGVPGLAEAVRRGRVSVVNGLGAGVLENPALAAFLPRLCEALLGEPLRLAGVPTWWCGDPASWRAVRHRVGADAAPAGSADDDAPVLVRTLDGHAAELAGLPGDVVRARVEAAPWRHVVQEQLRLSQAPTWPGGVSGAVLGAQPRPVVLRTFTLRHGSAYRPLAGGLARVLEEEGTGLRAVTSKDVWVQKAGAAEPDQGLAEILPDVGGRTLTGPVPGQLDDLYWAGRYAERAEDLLRLVLAAHALDDEVPEAVPTARGSALGVLLDVAAGLAPAAAGTVARTVDAALRSLLLDAGRPGSVAQSLGALRACLQGARDQLSADTWRAFGTVERAALALVTSEHPRAVGESAGRTLTGVLSLQGVFASMIRDPGWHMIGLGRHLERALQLVRLLRVTATARRGLDVDRVLLDATLGAAESAVTHRRRYRGDMRPSGVLDLLLMDPENPRSLLFALTTLREHLAALPGSTGSTRPERLLDDLLAELATTDVVALVPIGGEVRPNLTAFLDRFLDHLTRLADAVAEQHLTGGPALRTLGEFGGTGAAGGPAAGVPA